MSGYAPDFAHILEIVDEFYEDVKEVSEEPGRSASERLVLEGIAARLHFLSEVLRTETRVVAQAVRTAIANAEGGAT